MALNSLAIASYNAGGLNEPPKLRALARILKSKIVSDPSFGKMDVLILTETHLFTADSFPSHLLGFSWLHCFATHDDPAGGVSIGYSPLLPPPIVLSSVIFANDVTRVSSGLRSIFLLPELVLASRMLVVSFRLQSKCLVLGGLYGFTSNYNIKKRYSLIRDAFSMLLECSTLASATSTLPVCRILTGDLNLLPPSMNNLKGLWSVVNATSVGFVPKSEPHRKHWLGNSCNICAYRLFVSDPGSSASDFVNAAEITDMSLPGFKFSSTNLPSTGHYLTSKSVTSKVTSYSAKDHFLVDRRYSQDVFGGWNGSISTPDCLSTHNLIKISIANIWESPLLDSCSPGSTAYEQIPGFVFHDDFFLDKVIEHLKDHLSRPMLPTDWASLWTSFSVWLHSAGMKAARCIRDSINKRIAIVKGLLHNLRSTGGTSPSSSSYASFISLSSLLELLIKQRASDLAFADMSVVKDIADISVDSDGNVAPVTTQGFRDCAEAERNAKSSTTVLPGAYRSDGSVVTDHSSLCQRVEELYTLKFKPVHVKGRRHRRLAIADYLATRHGPCLSVDRSEKLDESYSQRELLDSCLSLSAGSSTATTTGRDALPSTLFTNARISGMVAEFLARVVNYATRVGRLPKSMMVVAYRLLHKDKKDPLAVLDKRAICLMSIGLRVITRAIGVRMNGVMDSLVGPNQRAYICGRRIDFNVAILGEVLMDAASKPTSKLIAFEADFAAAFDSIEHEFIRAVLKSFGFGPVITNLVMLIISKLSAAVIVNGKLTKNFPIKRGTPQGCFLSCILFVLALEPLLSKGLACGDLARGVMVSGEWLSYLAYADDLWIFCSCVRQLQEWYNLIVSFSLISGLHLQMSKTHIHLFGSHFWNHSLDLVTPPVTVFEDRVASVMGELSLAFPQFLLTLPPHDKLICVATDFKYVGILHSIRSLHNIPSSIYESSWSSTVSSLETHSSFLSFRTATTNFMDRRGLVYEKILSKVLYMSRSTNCPTHLIPRIQKLVNNFVFSSTAPLIKLQVATLEGMGGIGIPHVDSRLKAMSFDWITLLLSVSLPNCIASSLNSALISFSNALMVRVYGPYLLDLPPLQQSDPQRLIDMLQVTLTCGAMVLSTDALSQFVDTTLLGVRPIWKNAIAALILLKPSRVLLPPKPPSPSMIISKVSNETLIVLAKGALSESLFCNSVTSCLPTIRSPQIDILLMRFRLVGVNTLSDIWCVSTGSVKAHTVISAALSSLVITINCPANVGKTFFTSNSFHQWFDLFNLFDLLPTVNNENACNNTWLSLISKEWVKILLEIKKRGLCNHLLGSHLQRYNPLSYPSPYVLCARSPHKVDPLQTLQENWSSWSYKPLVDFDAKMLTNVFTYLFFLSFPVSSLSKEHRVPQGQVAWNLKFVASGLQPLPSSTWFEMWKTCYLKRIYPAAVLHTYFRVLHRIFVPKAFGESADAQPHHPNAKWRTCSWCGKEKTPIHALLECPGVTRFWMSISKQLSFLYADSGPCVDILAHYASIPLDLVDILTTGLSITTEKYPVLIASPSATRQAGIRCVILHAIFSIVAVKPPSSLDVNLYPLQPGYYCNSHSKALLIRFNFVLGKYLGKRLAESSTPAPRPVAQHDLINELEPYVYASGPRLYSKLDDPLIQSGISTFFTGLPLLLKIRSTNLDLNHPFSKL